MRFISSGLLAAAVAAASLAAPLAALAQDATPAANAPAGIDLGFLDLTADPGVDFNQFANGGWLKTAEIRPDRKSVSAFDELSDQTTRYVIDMLERRAADPALDPASDQGKVVAWFAQGMDQAARDAAGIAPLQPLLDRIAAIDSLDALYAYQQQSLFDGVGGVLPVTVMPDLKDSNVNAVYVGGPTFGLPNRDYYLDDAIGTPEIRSAYIDACVKLLEAAGYPAEQAQALAPKVLDLETKLVGPTLTREQQQVFSNFYNPMSLEELQTAYPDIDWTAFQEALGIPVQQRVIATETGYLEALPAILAAADLDTLKAMLTLQLMWANAGNLSDDIGEIAFGFKGRILGGLEQRAPLDERVLSDVEWPMGQAISRLYVEERFPPEAKAEMERLAADIKDAFRGRVERNAWMTPETKEKALEKLDALTLQIGYPDTWETYETVEVGPTYFDTGLSATRAKLRKDLDEITKPVDRNKWAMPPHAVNAYYNPLANQMVFPAGFLQPPFFELSAGVPVNYGAIGYVIGHEMTHGFDLQGSQFDAGGNLANWWTPADTEAFMALNQRAIDQYSAIEVAPGLEVNGQLTVGENVADLGGVQVAWDALQARLARDGIDLGATPAPDSAIAPPFTPAQEFFLSAAAIWRNKIRPEALATQVNTDPHAPAQVRVIQPLRNLDAFYEVFGITDADPAWLPPEERVVIW
ncbi:MAG: M13 family metallopeptidase [Chloroflexota bacterium]